MKITFGVTPYSNPQALADWLQAAGHQPELPDDEHSQDDIIDNSERVLLGYHHAELALQVAMLNGEAPQAAMAHWVEQAQRFIACFKANRDKVVLIDLGELHVSPQSACQALAEHWGLEGEAPAAMPALALPEATQAADLPACQRLALTLLARETLRQTPGWAALLAQLQACTLPLLGESSEKGAHGEGRAEPLEALYSRWQAATRHDQEKLDGLFATVEEQVGKQDQLKQDNHQLQERLHQAQEQLEVSHRQANERQKKEEAKQKAQQAKLEEVQQSLLHLQQQHQALDKARQSLSAQKTELEKQLATQQATLKEQGVKEQELEEENRLLLEQLHLVQEELEATLHQKKSLTQSQQTLGDEKVTLQRQLKERKNEVQRLTQQLEEQRKTYKQTSERLEKKTT